MFHGGLNFEIWSILISNGLRITEYMIGSAMEAKNGQGLACLELGLLHGKPKFSYLLLSSVSRYTDEALSLFLKYLPLEGIIQAHLDRSMYEVAAENAIAKVKLFLEVGANINWHVPYEIANEPFDGDVRGQVEYEHWARINWTGTALHEAARHSNRDMTKLLLGHGALRIFGILMESTQTNVQSKVVMKKLHL